MTAADFGPYARLFESLEHLFGVRFVVVGSAEPGEAPADCPTIVLGTPREAGALSGRTLVYAGRADQSSGPGSAFIRFSDSPRLPAVFRGVELQDSKLTVAATAELPTAGEVLAFAGQRPLWVIDSRDPRIEWVGATIPLLPENELLYSKFAPDQWFSTLPLLHFVLSVSRWTVPPIRACFMFDDPNLHWPSYGYVDFEALADDAAARNYHVSFATVPVDGWFVHPSASRLFRERPAHLSLLVHGNDHTHHELAQRTTMERRTALAAQALRRIERLEQRSGIPIAHIMVAPHEALNDEMAHALLLTGFDAGCISRSSLMTRNPDHAWPLTAGLTPAEFFGRGLPVIPRFNLLAAPELRARIAAFLGHGLIPVGHHEDLSGGHSVLHDRARLINSLPEATWMDMERIALSNYWTRPAHGGPNSEKLEVRMYARTISLQVPPGVTELTIERPWMASGTPEACSITIAAPPQQRAIANAPAGETPRIAVEPGATVTVHSVYPETVEPGAVMLPMTTPRALLRRYLCEMRDRFRPAVDMLTNHAR